MKHIPDEMRDALLVDVADVLCDRTVVAMMNLPCVEETSLARAIAADAIIGHLESCGWKVCRRSEAGN